MKTVNSKGVLYIVATPIGNLADFSYRAVDILRQVDCILCEDTRNSSILLRHYGIDKPKLSVYAHNEARRCVQLIQRLKQGQSFALISDAGTPLFSDAGNILVTACHNQSITVVPIPGANAAATALSASGFDGRRFTFEGFLPPIHNARIKRLQYLQRDERLIIFFEAPHRITATITDMIQVFGAQRNACLAKELSKIHECIVRGKLLDIQHWLARSKMQIKGEFVILLGACSVTDSDEITIPIEQLIDTLATYLPPSKVAAAVAKLSGLPRQHLYRIKSLNHNLAEPQDEKFNDKVL